MPCRRCSDGRTGAGAGRHLAVGPRPELQCLVGASGCGKSTLLNLVAGLDTPTRGELDVDGRPGLMFQESALFPWLTVAGNVDLALRLRNVKRDERRERVEELLELVHLSRLRRQPPARAVGRDAPAGRARPRARPGRGRPADGRAVRRARRDDPRRAARRAGADLAATGTTVVFVTHNVREAARLADRIVLLTSRPGRVAETFAVDIPRPRRIEDRDVSELAAEVTAALREEVARHGRR